MARLGKIVRQPCLNEPPPPDPRCADPVFALTHPEICKNIPSLVISPAFVLICELASVQFRAIYIDEDFNETDVTNDTVFASSQTEIVSISSSSGNATGLTTGQVTIQGTYNTLTAFSEVVVVGSGECCCDDKNVAMMLMVDVTKSMNQPLDVAYATKLHFAKAAATRFINEVNEQKDMVGLMTFHGVASSVLSSPTSNKAAVAALVPTISQTTNITKFYDPLGVAIDELSAVSADLRVIVIISDGQDTDDSYGTADNPISLLQNFKNAGGIVMCIGVRAYGFGYRLLNAFSTGGFFVNAYKATINSHPLPFPDIPAMVLDWMSGLKGYICAGNCVPEGDTYEPTGTLNYCNFEQWELREGHVDLLGNGFFDLLPGNGLYVDLAGSTAPHNGLLESAIPVGTIVGNFPYALQLKLAGNQRVDAPQTVRLTLFGIPEGPLIFNQVLTTPPALISGSPPAVVPVETYEYAVSYGTIHGETELTPAHTVTNQGRATFQIQITPDVIIPPDPEPSIVKVWKRESGTTTWYKIAEGANGATFIDTYNNARLEAAIADETIDVCEKPFDQNKTGIPDIVWEHEITIDDFEQDFKDYVIRFNAPPHMALGQVWLRIQQITTLAGDESVGILLDDISFIDDPEGAPFSLFEENFDEENPTYTPPACGMGTTYVPTADPSTAVLISGDPPYDGTYVFESATIWRMDSDYYIEFIPGLYTLYGPGATPAYECFENDFPAGPWADVGGGGAITGEYVTFLNYGYMYGYCGCYGEGCLDEPPPVQRHDPAPLPDNEIPGPPQLFNGTGSRTGSCEQGTVYVPSTVIAPVSVSTEVCKAVGIAQMDGMRIEFNIEVDADGNGLDYMYGLSEKQVENQSILRGENGQNYNVTLRIRGIVEVVAFLHSRMYEFPANTVFRRYFQYLDDGIEGAVDADDLTNAYFLVVSNPPQVYGLNGTEHPTTTDDDQTYDDGTPSLNVTHPIDYTVTIEIADDAEVTLIGMARDQFPVGPDLNKGQSLFNRCSYSTSPPFSFVNEVPFSTNNNLVALPDSGTVGLGAVPYVFTDTDIIQDADLPSNQQHLNRNQFVQITVVSIEPV